MNSLQETYQEHIPDSALSPFVACYWSSTTPASVAPVDHRVLPDGCIDIIFDLSPNSDSQGKVVGTMTGPLVFQTNGPVHLVAVRFRPGGAVPFLRVVAEEITDLQCELPKQWQAERLTARLHDETDASARTHQLESTLLRRLANIPPVDRRVETAIAMMQNPRFSIGSVAKTVDLSRQHLTRLFRQHVGIGPKAFARVKRMNTLLDLVKGLSRPNWPAIALDLGYYDQAHMICECRQLTGLTPIELSQR